MTRRQTTLTVVFPFVVAVWLVGCESTDPTPDVSATDATRKIELTTPDSGETTRTGRGELERGKAHKTSFTQGTTVDPGWPMLVAYSCKSRPVCPSCTGRRMATEVSAHLQEHVFSQVPVRQWVLSLPQRVRYLLSRHPDLCREVRGIFARAVQSFDVCSSRQ